MNIGTPREPPGWLASSQNAERIELEPRKDCVSSVVTGACYTINSLRCLCALSCADCQDLATKAQPTGCISRARAAERRDILEAQDLLTIATTSASCLQL